MRLNALQSGTHGGGGESSRRRGPLQAQNSASEKELWQNAEIQQNMGIDRSVIIHILYG